MSSRTPQAGAPSPTGSRRPGMPTRYTPPRPYRPCQGTVWQWLDAVQTAVDERMVPGLTATTVLVARALLAYADRDDGTARPGLAHLAARTQLARRTLLLHLGLLVNAGLLIRVARGRHATVVEHASTGRARHAAVYRLALPSAAPVAAPPPPVMSPTSARSPVDSCTPPRLVTSEEEPPDARENIAGLAASGDPATSPDGVRRARTVSRRPPPHPKTRRWRRWQAADELRAAVPLVFRGCSTPAVACAMRQGLDEGWTSDDFQLLLDRRPLPTRPDRLGGTTTLDHPAGLLAWRVAHWFTQHGPTRPTVEHADQLASRRRDQQRRRAIDARQLAELYDAANHAVPSDQNTVRAAQIRRRLGWSARGAQAARRQDSSEGS